MHPDECGYLPDDAGKVYTPPQHSKPEDPNHQYLTVTCMHCGHSIRVPQYCGNRFCSVCSGRRRARTKRRIKWLIHNVKHDKGARLKMITLSIKSEPNLGAMIGRLLGYFKLLRRTKYWKSHVSGGAFVIEVTGKEGLWHAHLHILVSATFMKWDTLHKVWKGISGGTGVFIQNIPGAQAINYVTKYVTKSECPEGDQFMVTRALKGTRLFQPFGAWYAVSNRYKDEPCGCPSCNSHKWSILEFEMNRLGWRSD